MDWVGSRCQAFTDSSAGPDAVPSYSELASESHHIIDFALPTNVSVSIARRLSGQLERGVTLELPARRVSLDALRRSHNSLSIGRLWLDSGALEALYLRRATPWLLAAAANIARPPTSGSQVRLTATRRTARASLSWCFASAGGIFGGRYLQRVTDRFRLGGELYYTGAENSGGLSLGARWLIMGSSADAAHQLVVHTAQPPIEGTHNVPPGAGLFERSPDGPAAVEPMVGTISVNPIMGHLQVTLTSPVLHPDVTSAVRYDMNIYSFDADLAVGLCYTPAPGQRLRLRASGRHGIALLLGTELGRGFRISAGISSGPIWERPSGIESVPNALKAHRPSIGLELFVES